MNYLRIKIVTYFPTHLALETTVLWLFLNDKEKENFSKKYNKIYFWIVAFFSLLPDIDIFFAIHRGPSHSVIIPLIMVVIGAIFNSHFRSKIAKDDDTESLYEFRAFISRLFIYAGLLWLFHILLDLEYPLAIFYPLSDRVYSLEMYLLIDVLPWFILPIQILGFFMELTGISYLQGLSTYFINWTPEQKINYFGSDTTVKLILENFWLHFFIFIIFLFFVARPNLPKFTINRLRRIKYGVKDPVFLVAGITILVLGIIVGPGLDFEIIETQEKSSTIQISESVLSPVFGISISTTNFLFSPNNVHRLTVHNNVTLNNFNINTNIYLVQSQYYSIFRSEISNLFKNHPMNSNENTTLFLEGYNESLDSLKEGSILTSSESSLNKTLSGSILDGNYVIISVLESWNNTEVLNGTRLLENQIIYLKLVTPRTSMVIIGSGLIIIALVLIIRSGSYLKVNEIKENNFK